MSPHSARTGKLARLPHALRDEVNQRLHDGQPANSILDWLNALPEVQSVLREHFNGRPIAACNLTEWKNGGYHDWCLRQDALGIVDSLADQASLGDPLLADGFNDKIAQWTSIHLASTARAVLASETDLKARLDLLHQFNADVNRLRRNDLHAERLSIERVRLDLETQSAREKTDDEFWAWTKRPDIAKKLNPEKPQGISRRRLHEIEQALCLRENNFDHQLIGRLMRQRRLTHEAAAILLAEKTAELDAAELANSPNAAGPVDAPDNDEVSGDEARFAALCAERGLVLPPDDPDSFSEVESSPHVAPNLAPSEISARVPLPTLDDQPLSHTTAEAHPNCARETPNSELKNEPSTLDDRPSTYTSAPTPASASDFCVHCYSPLPPLTESNERPFPRCRACGRPTPDPGKALYQLPDSPPPHRPEEHCPRCVAMLPPILPDGTRPDAWCAACGFPLPDPKSLVEHCPHCGGRIPEFNHTDPRPTADCVHCGRILPPVPLPRLPRRAL
jgi:hypothetical protein